MKLFLVTSIISLFSISSVLAQSENDILGKWQSAHGNGKIEVYKKSDKFFGRLIWVKDGKDEDGKPLTDMNNPDETLKNRPLIGTDLFKDLKYRGSDVWGGGTVYDPKSGKTYNCQMTLKDPKKLAIRAFFGIALIGQTETWSKVQ